MRRPALALAIGAALGCKPELRVWEGRYLDYQTSDTLQVCGGTHAYADGFIGFLAEELGVEVEERLRYYWLDQDDHRSILKRCGELEHCASGRAAKSSEPDKLHELVHLVFSAVTDGAPAFFIEGVAVAYAGDRTSAFRYPKLRVDPRPTMAAVDDSEVFYPSAGGFVLYLLTVHGPEAFVRLYAQARNTGDMSTIRADFLRAYGHDLDAEVEQYMADIACPEDHFVVLPYDCATPSVAWQGGGWSYSATVDCEDEDVRGGVGPERAWRSEKAVTLAVPEAGRYRLRAYGDEGVRARLGACFGCPWDRDDAQVWTGEALEVELEVGSYFLRLSADSDASPRVGVELVPLDVGEGG